MGQRYRDELRIDRQAIDSVILIEDGRWYQEGDAALRVARELGGAWKALTVSG